MIDYYVVNSIGEIKPYGGTTLEKVCKGLEELIVTCVETNNFDLLEKLVDLRKLTK